jgi:hypothetical protein
MANARYKRGRYGDNVIQFKHPTRDYCEVTGLFIDAYVCDFKHIYMCVSESSPSAALGGCYYSLTDCVKELKKHQRCGILDAYIAKL